MIGGHANLFQDPDPQRAFELARDAFHRHGIVCIPIAAMEAKAGWVAARNLRNLGEQYFGKRKV
jgi:hypothetical protein